MPLPIGWSVAERKTGCLGIREDATFKLCISRKHLGAEIYYSLIRVGKVVAGLSTTKPT